MSIRTVISLIAVFCAFFTAETAARADVITFQDNLNYLPSIGGYGITALSPSATDIGQSSFSLGSGTGAATVTVDGTAMSQGQGVVQGSKTGYYAEPVTGGSVSNPTYYTSPYFSTGTGAINITFNQSQKFLGLL